jgi:hypothetical protein
LLIIKRATDVWGVAIFQLNDILDDSSWRQSGICSQLLVLRLFDTAFASQLDWDWDDGWRFWPEQHPIAMNQFSSALRFVKYIPKR